MVLVEVISPLYPLSLFISMIKLFRLFFYAFYFVATNRGEFYLVYTLIMDMDKRETR